MAAMREYIDDKDLRMLSILYLPALLNVCKASYQQLDDYPS